MYLNSGVDYYLVVLEGITIVCKSELRVLSPSIKIKLLSYPDLNKIEIMSNSGMKDMDINEEICNKCVINIIGFDGEEIDYDQSPAGVTDHLATKIKLNSLSVFNDLEKSFNSLSAIASMYERISLVVAHYTNNTYEYTQNLPIDELIKRYALCCLAFNAPPIVFEEESESKVG